MKKIIIHIGDAKTGTSSIQNHLTKNRKHLEEKGILYSKVGLLATYGIANHKLSYCLKNNREEDQKNADSLYANLKNEIDSSPCDYIIISSEGFCSLRTVTEIEKLRSYLSDYDVKILAYLRRPDLWIESWYPQIVKNEPFVTVTFEEYIKKHQPASLITVLKYADVFWGREYASKILFSRRYV